MFHFHQMHTLATFSLILIGFLILLAIVHVLRLIYGLFMIRRSSDTDGVLQHDVNSIISVEESRSRETSYTEEINGSETSRRYLPSRYKMLDIAITTKKSELPKNLEGISVQAIEPPPEYSKVVLPHPHNTMYVRGLSNEPRVSHIYIRKLETPGTKKPSKPTAPKSSWFDFKRMRRLSEPKLQMIGVGEASARSTTGTDVAKPANQTTSDTDLTTQPCQQPTSSKKSTSMKLTTITSGSPPALHPMATAASPVVVRTVSPSAAIGANKCTDSEKKNKVVKK